MQPDRTLSIVHHGREAEPVIVIDNFIDRPDLLIADATMLSFKPVGLHYPGVRAVIAPRLIERFLEPVAQTIAETFNVDVDQMKAEGWYSLVTTQPEDLAPIQRLPHFDGVGQNRLALLHYLDPAEAGGTAFYRHRVTGFETVTAERLAPFTAALEADVERHGMPSPAYIAGDTAIYEQIARYDGLFNRAIIYRGHTLHCADIPVDRSLSTDPSAGRLTANTFLDC